MLPCLCVDWATFLIKQKNKATVSHSYEVQCGERTLRPMFFNRATMSKGEWRLRSLDTHPLGYVGTITAFRYQSCSVHETLMPVTFSWTGCLAYEDMKNTGLNRRNKFSTNVKKSSASWAWGLQDWYHPSYIMGTGGGAPNTALHREGSLSLLWAYIQVLYSPWHERVCLECA